MTEIKNLESLFKMGTITRREFLARVSALGLTAALSPALFTTSVQASTPKKGGRFRMALRGGSTADSLDSASVSDDFTINFKNQLRNCLVEIDHNLNPVPELAESWEATPDAAKWIFKLRKGVEFHNGKTLDAEDVLFSINHHRGKDSKSAAKGQLTPITEIKADGKYTVIFTLNSGNADFPFLMSDYYLSISPAGTKGADWEKGIGTGGYILESFEPGVRGFTKRNPNYWKEGRAHFDEIETIHIADTPARTNALRTGKIDYMATADTRTVHLLEKAPGIKVIVVPSGFHFYLPMLTDVPPYNNNDVRLALKYAIDREHLVKISLGGYGRAANDHPISQMHRYYAHELPQREYDPDKAKFHIKKAGMEGHTFKLYSADELGWLDCAMLYKEQAAKANINIEVIREPLDAYWSNVWLKRPFCSSQLGGRVSEDWMFTLSYAAESTWNDTHWKHERFNKLLKEARAELNEPKRREMYVEMQRIVRDEGGSIVYMFKDWVEAASSKVKYGEITGTYAADGARNAERWWFES